MVYPLYCVAVTHSPTGAAHSEQRVVGTDTDSYEILIIGGRHRDGTPDDPSHDWGQAVTGTVANQIKWWRKERGISAQELSDRCDGLGHSVPRNIIANIENGRRSAVTLQELLVIAMALNVPPI